MAIAASLNVNLTATSGQFTSTMTKAAGTMKKVGMAASTVSRAVKGFIAFEAVKKSFNFISHAVGDIEQLADAAEKAGFSLSSMEKIKLGTAQLEADNLAGAFAKMKLQFITGLAPAIQYAADMLRWFTNIGIDGFSVMEMAGRQVGNVIIIIGKGFQIAIKLMAMGLRPLVEILAGISVMAAEAATKLGQMGMASGFKEIADQAGRIGQSLQSVDQSLKWEEIFAWPEFRALTADIQREAKATKKELQIPEGIKLGTGADAIFGYKQKQMRINAAATGRANPQQNAQRQTALMERMERALVKIERNTAAVPEVVTA